MSRPKRFRRPEPRNGRVGGDTHAHNTLSAEAIHVQVFYPFHPLHGKTLGSSADLKPLMVQALS